jgi:hypothetical protein
VVDRNIGIAEVKMDNFTDRQNRKFDSFVQALKDVLCEADFEIQRIHMGEYSAWTENLIVKWIKPEISRLLEYALNGVIHFEYGKKNRRLQSAYLLIEGLDTRSETTLGEKIFLLQDIYNRM